MQVRLLLDGRQIDDTELAHGGDIVGVLHAALLHGLAGSLDHPPHPGLAHEHVVRLLGQHEAAGARERIEGRLGERQQLIFAVAVRERREHHEREPVVDRLVERLQDARLVGIAGATLQQHLGFLAAVAAEVGVEQIDHRPQMAAFLDVHLEKVSQIVERRAGPAEAALLLDRGGLGIALRHHQAA